MRLSELMKNSVLDFLNGSRSIDEYAGLSVMTDGLSASGNNIVGLCAVDGFNQPVCTILFKGGSPDVTEPYHQIPIDKFMLEGMEPREGFSKFLDDLGNRYIVMHNDSFGEKFLNEFTAKHNIPPMDVPIIGSGTLYQATITSGTLLPAMSEDISLTELNKSLNMCTYPRNTKKSLDTLYTQCPSDDYTDYVKRQPAGIANAYKIVATYRMLLESQIFA